MKILAVMHVCEKDAHLAPQVIERLKMPVLVQAETGVGTPAGENVQAVTTSLVGTEAALFYKLRELLPIIEASGCTHILRIDPDAMPLGDLEAAFMAEPADLAGSPQTSYHGPPMRVIAGFCALLSLPLLRATCAHPGLHTEEATWTTVARSGNYRIREMPELIHTHTLPPEHALLIHPHRSLNE